MGISDAIKHFEALQKRFTTQHNGTACEHVRLALEGLKRMAEQPEVVHCVVCAKRNTCDCPMGYAVEWGIGNELPGDGDYCSYGERKEDT